MSKKLTYQYVKEYIEKEGYKLLNTEYINSNIKLNIECNKGHVFKMTLGNFQQGQRCFECKKLLKYLEIKQYIKSFDYELLDIKYISNNKLTIKCPYGHVFKMLWGSFKSGQRCSVCFKTLVHINIKNLQKEILKTGYKLLSTEYKDYMTKLEFLCPKGHKFKTTLSAFKRTNQRCPICRKLLKYLDIKKCIEKNDYKLLSTKYINSRSKIKIKCNKNHIFYIRWNDFQQGRRCPKCFYESLYKNYTPDQLKKLYNYQLAARNLTEINYKKYFNSINPKNKNRGQYEYHLDHIFPVIEGFRRNIDIEIIANPYNLQILSARENLIKHDNPWQTKKELYKGYSKYINDKKI